MKLALNTYQKKNPQSILIKISSTYMKINPFSENQRSAILWDKATKEWNSKFKWLNEITVKMIVFISGWYVQFLIEVTKDQVFTLWD